MMRKKVLLMMLFTAVLLLSGIGLSASAAPAVYVHNVVSEKPLYVLDGTTGSWLTATAGDAVASWTENPLASGNQAFFNAKVYVNNDLYEFRLVSLGATTHDSISGKFDIYKNYVKVASVGGTAYGLSGPVGAYYKFYDSASTWHVSGYITHRLDY